MRFRDRADAGRKLARALAAYKSDKPLVLALLRGGVPVAAEVAAALDAPLDILLVRKIGAPFQPELALGAVVDGKSPIIVKNPYVIESTDISEEDFDRVCREELEEIERRRALFIGDRPQLDPKDRVVIVIDDGIATGATMRAALQATRARGPKKLILAVPVAPTETLQSLRTEADDVVSLADLDSFGAVGHFYDDFHQLSDEEVIATLRRFRAGGEPSAPLKPEALRRIAGDIEDAKASEILSLKPSEAEFETALAWANGGGDVADRQGHPLAGKAARIFDILTADEDDDGRG